MAAMNVTKMDILNGREQLCLRHLSCPSLTICHA